MPLWDATLSGCAMRDIDSMTEAFRSPRPLVVWCAGTSWDGVAGTDRHMALKLRAYADVLWVDPPMSLIKSSRRVWPTLSSVERDLIRLTPRALPLHSRRPVRPLTMALLRLQIRWALRELGRRPEVVVACSLDDVLGSWGTDVLEVLYGTDDFVAGAALMGLGRRAVERDEARQLRRADVAVVVSEAIAVRWRSLGFDRPIHVVPNGVEVSAYRDLAAVLRAPDVELPSPVAGLVGQLSSRIDIGLLGAVVDSGCSLLLVGPHDPAWEPERFSRLASHRRVSWVGAQPFDRLPGYMKCIDVGLTPYCDTAFNRASVPLKTLEYLAAGKPVVSTELPATRALATDLIEIAGAEEYGRRVRQVGSAASSAEIVRRRVAFAMRHSWERRAEAFAAASGLRAASMREVPCA